MAEIGVLAYFGLGTILFFFWIYGIASFVLDVKNTLIPALVQYRRGRTAQREAAEEEREREERMEELL